MIVRPTARPSRRPLLLLGALAFTLLLTAVVTTRAEAATSVTPNACRYSIDGFYRDMPLTVTTSTSVLADARHPSPTTTVDPGQTVRSAAGTFDVELPAYLAPFGYALGLLKPGPNTIDARVWLAVRGSNTRERARVVGPIDISATTTITVDPADDNRFASATPFAYTIPVLPQFDWTAVGGDVAIGQAGPGTLPTLPVGPGNAPRGIQAAPSSSLRSRAAAASTSTASPAPPPASPTTSRAPRSRRARRCRPTRRAAPAT